MKHPVRTLIAAVAVACVAAGTAQAAPVFSDNFNAENGGAGTLNYSGFANWNVTAGSVDLIGNGYFDFLPGNGLYVDMNGSTGQGGTIATKTTFAPGAYTVRFDFAGSRRGPDGIVTVALGDFSQVINLASATGFTTFSYAVDVTVAGALNLSFASGVPGGNIGGLLDNVTVSTRQPGAVPEPAALLLFGSGLVALGWMRRRAG